MAFPQGRIPLYLQLYWKLRQDILLGELTPGNRVPTIIDLHKRHGVSQGTVRQALDLLEKDGLISLKAGSGIFVNKDIVTMLWSEISSIEDIQSTYDNVDDEILSQAWVDAPNRIRSRFVDLKGALKDGQIYQIKIRQVDKSEPTKKQFMVIFIPAWRADNTSEEEIVHPLEEAELESRKEHAQSTLQPWICSYEIGEILGLAEGTPILRNEWIHYLQDGRTASISETYLTANALVRKLEWDV